MNDPNQKAFEEWAKTLDLPLEASTRGSEVTYLENVTRVVWEAWQAACEYSLQRCGVSGIRSDVVILPL